jgi:type III restriction enzyme
MSLKLEDLDYQGDAVAAVVAALDGQVRNTFERANLFGIHANVVDLTPEQIRKNMCQVIAANGIPEEEAHLSDDRDICIEMETGTGKTLVYLRTAYELHKTYGLTKFIILVPSVPIREGVLASFDDFGEALEQRYGFKVSPIEYDSAKVVRLKSFIEDPRPQIMVMTIQSFNADDRIINQAGRDDSYNGKTFLQALGDCRPILIMDEPQEGMDTPNAVARIATLNPQFCLRYSATHKVIKNRLYRLTPADAYAQSLVKKIEVLSVVEKNDEATFKIELADVRLGSGKNRNTAPQAKLTLWRKRANGNFEWKASNWLKPGDNLADKSDNVSYRDYTIERIWKSLNDGQFRVKFRNGVELTKRERSGDYAGLFRVQLHYLIRRHFEKKAALVPKGIKPLSLVFIDKVENFMGDTPVIRTIFREEYAKAHREVYGKDATPEQIEEIQGFYFAKTGHGNFTDSEAAMAKNKAIFDEILRDKAELLRIGNPREFIFTHSALGVGWDNPNVFNIATLNVAYDENRKRQEIGRGLRICRDQSGQRVYDVPDVKEGEEINLLTVVPNESYETFARDYQEQIKEAYGDASKGSPLRKKHKGKDAKNVIRRTARYDSDEFKRFWERLAKKTDYTVAFDEAALVTRAAEALDTISVGAYQAEVTLTRMTSLAGERIEGEYIGGEVEALRPEFARLDLIEELSENTGLAYPTVFQILSTMENLTAAVTNPVRFLTAASAAIKAIEVEEMIRTLSYHPTGESILLSELLPTIETYFPVEPTPTRGVYDGVAYESGPEHGFAKDAEKDGEVICFLKLPSSYRIPTPVGNYYEPDFGLVLKRRKLKTPDEQEYYFVVETKSTNNIDDQRSLTEVERLKIRCAVKHFEALGIEAKLEYVPYVAPVKDYQADFKPKVPQ